MPNTYWRQPLCLKRHVFTDVKHFMNDVLLCGIILFNIRRSILHVTKSLYLSYRITPNLTVCWDLKMSTASGYWKMFWSRNSWIRHTHWISLKYIDRQICLVNRDRRHHGYHGNWIKSRLEMFTTFTESLLQWQKSLFCFVFMHLHWQSLLRHPLIDNCYNVSYFFSIIRIYPAEKQ